ncbi:unnamed protein product [Camellia sinensis]
MLLASLLVLEKVAAIIDELLLGLHNKFLFCIRYFSGNSLLLVECRRVKIAVNFCFCYPRKNYEGNFCF